ncbi:MAG: hypothetical protein M1816_003055 [Peltula sp. TS41687]|nr:MAG: hypothetical protein M1816_003055 [Peltula sp. TS41687]
MSLLGRHAKQAFIGYATHDQKAYQIVGEENTLDNHPSPIMVTDRRGRSKWTISIPPELEFPLHPKHYVEMCLASMKMAKRVDELKSHTPHNNHVVGHHSYYYVDPNFMDVSEAEKHGLLPIGEPSRSRNWESKNTCRKSLTYVLESSNAGLGNVLLSLWLAYGLARKEGRAFFIDDTNWAYGSYKTYFAPPLRPSCHPPPRTQILPCPHQASHLVVSAATTKYTFGHTFSEEYEDPYRSDVLRQKPISDLAREGYEALFHLRPEEAAYVQERKTQLIEDDGRRLVGVHIRHGDHHPWEFEHHKSYLPLETYISTAVELNLSLEHHQTAQQQQKTTTTILLASDDPQVYTDLQSLHSATTRAQPQVSYPESGNIWSGEGGFSNKKFQSLLNSTTSTADASQVARKTIEALARSYFLDLAMLGQTETEAVVCAVSSVTCRLLAVMMGWDALVDGKWKNVDGDWTWSGLEW